MFASHNRFCLSCRLVLCNHISSLVYHVMFITFMSVRRLYNSCICSYLDDLISVGITAQRCPILRVPQKGSVSHSADSFEAEIGVTVTFTCEQGYIVEGATDIECKRGGHWSSNVPNCIQG